MPLYSRLTYLSAVFIGGLFFNFVPVTQGSAFGFSLKRTISFLLVALFSYSLRTIVRRDFLDRSSESGKTMKAFNVVAATMGTLFSLELFRYYSGPYPFYLLLLIGISQVLELRYRCNVTLALLFSFFWLWGSAVLSIWTVVGVLGWESIFVGLALACMLSALSVVLLNFSRAQMERLYPLLMPIGPLIIGAFPLFGRAPRIYCAILIIIAMAQTLVRILKTGGSLAWIRREATGVCYLFVVMLVLLRFF